MKKKKIINIVITNLIFLCLFIGFFIAGSQYGMQKMCEDSGGKLRKEFESNTIYCYLGNLTTEKYINYPDINFNFSDFGGDYGK